MADQEYWDAFLGVDLEQVDPETDLIIGFEEERQARKLIMIPSESMAPKAVRQALGSVFNNIYAEGYPPLRMTRDEEAINWRTTDATAIAASTRAWIMSTLSRRWLSVEPLPVLPTSAQEPAIFTSMYSPCLAQRLTWPYTMQSSTRATWSWACTSTRAAT
jgi:hypothetical protein